MDEPPQKIHRLAVLIGLVMGESESKTKETEQREEETLKRLLATPPDHKRKGKSAGSPKKLDQGAEKKPGT